MSDEGEWIRSGKANLLLVQAGKYPAEFQLRQALLIGQVRGRAIRAEITKRGRYGGKDAFDNWDVPAEVWKGSAENSHFDLETDTYSTGSYEVRLGSVKLWGMSFNKSEILSYFDIEDSVFVKTAPHPAPEKGKGGRSADADKWNNALAALMVYVQSGPFQLDDQPGATLRKALDFASTLGLADDAISIDRCRDGILKAKQMIRKAENLDDQDV